MYASHGEKQLADDDIEYGVVVYEPTFVQLATAMKARSACGMSLQTLKLVHCTFLGIDGAARGVSMLE
jgi:hypothetical protein